MSDTQAIEVDDDFNQLGEDELCILFIEPSVLEGFDALEEVMRGSAREARSAWSGLDLLLLLLRRAFINNTLVLGDPRASVQLLNLKKCISNSLTDRVKYDNTK